MITFSQFLTEARMAPLYHGTSMEAIRKMGYGKEGILPTTSHFAQNLLKATGKSFGASINGVSTTRSYKFAQRWAKDIDANKWAVIELDQTKLTTRYQIKPIKNYFHHKATRLMGDSSLNNQSEEFIISSKEIPVTYITKITYYVSNNTNNKEKYGIAMQEIKNKNPNIKFVCGDKTHGVNYDFL